MNTADLIDQLVADTRAVRRHRRRDELSVGILAGAGVTLAAVLLAFGLQSGLAQPDRLVPLLMKLAFAAALGIPAFMVVGRLAQPGVDAGDLVRSVLVPTLMLAALAIWQLSIAPTASWPDMAMGESWRRCPVRIVTLSLPILIGLILALRRQAPVDLRRAGAVAGLMAGALAAAIYALACTEASAAFVLLWYSAGIAAATALGALIGPLALRW